MIFGNSSQQNDDKDAARSIPAAITDTGCERDLNEDRYAVIESSAGLAWVVCDGMGGTTGGELAAQLAIDAMRRHLDSLQGVEIESALRSTLLEANRIIVLRRQNPAFSAMGTTVVAMMIDDNDVVIGHVGDSRAYLLRDGAIQQLTTDHTLVQELVDKKQIKAEDALSHPQAHILTRCIGSEPGLDVAVSRFWIWQVAEEEARDYLLLCTDGLYSMVTEGEIANILRNDSPQQACVKLVELAKNRGGFDNITLAIIPLPGQLKHEPPVGYKKDDKKKQKKQTEVQASEPGSLFRAAIIVTMLSVLAAMLTALVMAFRLSQ